MGGTQYNQPHMWQPGTLATEDKNGSPNTVWLHVSIGHNTRPLNAEKNYQYCISATYKSLHTYVTADNPNIYKSESTPIVHTSIRSYIYYKNKPQTIVTEFRQLRYKSQEYRSRNFGKAVCMLSEYAAEKDAAASAIRPRNQGQSGTRATGTKLPLSRS